MTIPNNAAMGDECVLWVSNSSNVTISGAGQTVIDYTGNATNSAPGPNWYHIYYLGSNTWLKL
jgi:hypothetical protein